MPFQHMLLVIFFLYSQCISLSAATSEIITDQHVGMDIHGVYNLDPSTYDTLVMRGQKSSRHGTIIKFFAPWCQHCQALVEPWHLLAHACGTHSETLKGDKTSVQSLAVASFNCDANTEHRNFCKDLGIRAFPHIRYAEGTVHADYLGSRSLKDIVVFIEIQSGIGPFEFLTGFNRFTAYVQRYILSLMQFAMESNNDIGGKPSTRSLITLVIIISVPILACGGGVLLCLYYTLFREQYGSKLQYGTASGDSGKHYSNGHNNTNDNKAQSKKSL